MQPRATRTQNLKDAEGSTLSQKFDNDNWRIVVEIVKIAVPAMMCQFAAFFQRSTNIMIIGILGDDKKLAGVGLGNAEIENFGMCVWMGLIGGL